MWLAPLLQVLAFGATAPQAAIAPPSSSSAPPAPIYSREPRFDIPFRISRPDRITQEPVEVQLHVSGDRGTRWDLYKKLPAASNKFPFRAGNDGEYWFCIRTLDRSGRTSPAGPPTPGLRVIVDTAPPKVQFEARRGEGGQIVARWRVDETNLKPESLKIQYRTARTAPWQPVAVGRQDIQSAGSTHTGQVAWLAPAATSGLEVRAEVTDLAGNPGVSQVALNDNRAVAAGSGDPRGAIAPTTNWPAENAGAGARYAAERPSGRTAVVMSAERQPGDPSSGGVSMRVNPPIRSQFVDSQQKSGNVGGSAAENTGIVKVGSGVPDGERVRWINERELTLDYETDSVGPSGIARVELWGSRDGGRTWRSYGVDNDNRSPITVMAEDEGIYGFRVAIQNGAGQGGRPPKSGDLPAIWVGVDLTKPAGRITGAEQGIGADADKLIISWQAGDNNKLPARCISLSFSETLGGPWTTIASGLEDSGRYAWRLDNRAPQHVYLRLEVKDEAGNLGTYETTQPLSPDRGEPTARIRDVRPLSQTGQPGQQAQQPSIWR